MNWARAAKATGSRLLTLGCYLLAIIGASSWDRDPDSYLIAVRLMMAATFAWWAVARTVRHVHEDRKDSDA